MSIIENMCPNTFYMCSKSYEFWFTPTIDGNSRRIELFRYDFQEEDDCVECYLCVLPFAFAVDITLCPCYLYTSSNCCYFCSSNKIKPVFFEEKINENNEICEKNIQFYQNLEKSTQNTDNLDVMNDTDSNRTYILSSPTPSNNSSIGSVSSASCTSNSDSNDSDNDNDCVFVKNKCTKTLELVNENDI